MAREADYDADLFAEMIRTGRWSEGSQHPIADVAEKPDVPERPRPSR